MHHEPVLPENIQAISATVTAYYGLERPTGEATEAPAVVVAMHGWGQNASRFARYFAKLTAQNVLIVAPQGFHQFYLDPGAKKVGFNWLTVFERAAAIADCNKFIDQILNSLSDDFNPERVYLLGFSQGSAMAWRYAMSAQRPVAGLISIGADLPPDVAAALASATPFPVLLLRGAEDELVAQPVMDETAAVLREREWPFEQATYPGEHRINDAAVMRIAQWLDGKTD